MIAGVAGPAPLCYAKLYSQQGRGMHPTPPLGQSSVDLRLPRRGLLAAACGLGGLALAGPGLARIPPMARRGTPQLMLGPFHPVDRPRDQDADLTRVIGQSGRAHGVVMALTGQVLGEAGRPVAGASIDLWQTNGYGRYHHPGDPIDRPLDPRFQGSAQIRADGQGRFRLLTIMPLPYGRRQRHIHFVVRGRKRRLGTQMFFPGEPNERDSLYPGLRSAALQQAVTARDDGFAEGVRRYRWDIVLAGE